MVKRTEFLIFRLNAKDYQKILERAASLNLTFSEFARRRLLGNPVVPEQDLRRLMELKELGRRLKQTLLETKGTYSQDLADAISAIGSFAREQTEIMNRKNQNGTRKRHGTEIQ